MPGWISIHRCIWENWIWKDKPFSKGQAWIDILLMVNYEKGKVYFRDASYDVERGQKITSELKLAERWGWSRTKVRRFLNDLEMEQMLSVKRDNRKTIIEVANYNKYQDNITTENTSDDTTDDTTDVQQKNINNNINKSNKVNKENIYSSVVDYLNLKCNTKYKSSSAKTKSLIDARVNEKFTLDDFKKVIDIKSAEWLNNENMAKYLRPETLFGNKFESYLNQQQKGGEDNGKYGNRIQFTVPKVERKDNGKSLDEEIAELGLL